MKMHAFHRRKRLLCVNSHHKWHQLRNFSVQSNRDKGVEFEEQVLRAMHSLGCALAPTQLANDEGIDHQGTWTLPDSSIDVVTQCKNEQKPVGVQALREFHGVLHAFPPTSVLGLFASSSGYSIYARRYFLHMDHPAMLVTLQQGVFTSFLLNPRAQSLLPKLTIGSVYIDNHRHAIVLTYDSHLLTT